MSINVNRVYVSNLSTDLKTTDEIKNNVKTYVNPYRPKRQDRAIGRMRVRVWLERGKIIKKF